MKKELLYKSMADEDLCNKLCAIIEEVAVFISDEAQKMDAGFVKEKGFNNFVTYVDSSAEEMLIEKLQKLIPESSFLAEEGTVAHKKAEYTWIIDPLDGTTNFIHGIPVYSISVALSKNEKLVLGAVYEVVRKECFYAFGPGEAYLNTRKIGVSKAKDLKSSLLATGFPYDDFERFAEYLNVLRMAAEKSHGIRRIGSAAVDLAYTACGRFEGFFEYNLNPWDVAAGGFILEMAGGKNTDFQGGSNWLYGKQIVSSNSLIHNELLGIIQDNF